MKGNIIVRQIISSGRQQIMLKTPFLNNTDLLEKIEKISKNYDIDGYNKILCVDVDNSPKEEDRPIAWLIELLLRQEKGVEKIDDVPLDVIELFEKLNLAYKGTLTAEALKLLEL